MKPLFSTFTLTLAAIVTSGVVSCKEPTSPDDKPIDGDGNIELSTHSLEFTAEGETKTVDVTGKNWSTTRSAEWIGVTEAEGNITVTVGANETEQARKGTITVKNADDRQMINVEQAAGTIAPPPPPPDPYLEVDPEELNFAGAGGDLTVEISTNTDDWSAFEPDEWLTLEQSGNDLIITAAPNPTTTPRMTWVGVHAKNKTLQKNIVVNQEGKVAGPELELSTEEISAGQYVTTSIINVTCEMDWTATPSHDWINVGSGNGSGNGTIVVIIYANETGATRNGTITVSNTINQKIVSVTQSGN